jgi:hypothetical protein
MNLAKRCELFPNPFNRKKLERFSTQPQARSRPIVTLTGTGRMAVTDSLLRARLPTKDINQTKGKLLGMSTAGKTG